MKRLIIYTLGCWALGLGALTAETPREPKASDVPQLITDLSSTDAKVRLAACSALQTLGNNKVPQTKNAIGPLLELTKKDSDPSVRGAAAMALGRIEGAADKAVPVLLDRLKKDKDRGATLANLKAIGDFGIAAKDAIPQLREILKKAQEDVAAAEKALAQAKKDGNTEQEKAANTKLVEARELEATTRSVYVVVFDNR